MANEVELTHMQMLRSLADGEHLPVGRQDLGWEHNAAVLDDLIHDGFARGPAQLPHDGAGAYFSVRGIRITDSGRRRLKEAPADRPGALKFVDGGGMARLEPMLHAVQRFLDDHGGEIDPEDAASLAAQLETIRAQGRTERPVEAVVAGAVGMIRWIAEQVGAAVVGAGTAVLITQASGIFT